jgi:hypothetical protein
MKTTQLPGATKGLSSESVGKKLGEALIWVVDIFDACLDQHEISLQLAKSEMRSRIKVA